MNAWRKIADVRMQRTRHALVMLVHVGVCTSADCLASMSGHRTEHRALTLDRLGGARTTRRARAQSRADVVMAMASERALAAPDVALEGHQ
eukprot:3109414-Pleurochrysis_carterae.AAC.2